MSIPRCEFPNPQFERSEWMNLNGEWDFEFDFGKSKDRRGIVGREEWESKIIVPFCPESELSGICYKDFIPAAWYRRSFELTESNLSGRVLLKFGAVDYEAVVYVNGRKVGRHFGGYTSFTFDITAFVRIGSNTLVVNAIDDIHNPTHANGKQSRIYESHGCDYTRTTGIWQTVWLEFVPENYIKSVKMYPDAGNGTIGISAVLEGKGEFRVSASYEGRPMGCVKKKANGNVNCEIKLDEIYLWEPGCGRLYDLELSFAGDVVKSYFGLRDIAIDGYRFLINGKSVFQRLILDQGFYPDGIYTAETDEKLKNDIVLSMNAGFNGARLHQKIFEPRFLYHCDCLGYLTWGEYPNWGLDYSNPAVTDAMLPEWMEEIERDFNHPSIIGWCPFNETWDYEGRRQRNELLETIYKATKVIDKTRPCIDVSGGYHVITDIYDTHDYEQNPEVFRERYSKLTECGELYDNCGKRMPEECRYHGGIVFISEYGGIRWSMNPDDNAWGYGNAPKTEEEFIARYKGLTDVLLDNDRMFGFCYTQLTDVEQEQNGIYTYERKTKFDPAIFKKINSRKAAIED